MVKNTVMIKRERVTAAVKGDGSAHNEKPLQSQTSAFKEPHQKLAFECIFTPALKYSCSLWSIHVNQCASLSLEGERWETEGIQRAGSHSGVLMSLAHGTLGPDANDPPRGDVPQPPTSLVRPATGWLLWGEAMVSAACCDWAKLAHEINCTFEIIIQIFLLYCSSSRFNELNIEQTFAINNPELCFMSPFTYLHCDTLDIYTYY